MYVHGGSIHRGRRRSDCVSPSWTSQDDDLVWTAVAWDDFVVLGRSGVVALVRPLVQREVLWPEGVLWDGDESRLMFVTATGLGRGDRAVWGQAWSGLRVAELVDVVERVGCVDSGLGAEVVGCCVSG